MGAEAVASQGISEALERKQNHTNLEVHMYIDPATGSIVLQVMAAGILAVAASISSWRESVKRLFLRIFVKGRDGSS